MPVNWHAEIMEQLDFYWKVSLRPRLDGLTDDEYFWEPVPGCWSVRPAGDGSFSIDWAWPAPDPPPFTTIAWRLAHIAGPVLGFRASNHFGDGSLKLESIEWPGTATDAVDFRGPELRGMEGRCGRARRGRPGSRRRPRRRSVC